MTTIVESQPARAELYVSAIGASAEVVPSIDQLKRHLDERRNEYAIVLGPSVDLEAAVHLADTLRVTRPALSVILLRQRVDTSVLAEALRSGMREVVEDRDLTGIGQAVRRAHSLHEALTLGEPGDAAQKQGRLITVFSAKGGVGKTTVATNLAVALADKGRHQVCLVDLDLGFGDVAISLQMFPSRTIADAVPMQGSLDADGIESLLTKYSDGLSALVAPPQPDAKDAISHQLVGRILRTLKKRFDYVIVDTPPAFDDHVLQAFDESDLLLLLLTLDIPALKNLKVTLETLDLLNLPREQCRIILNRADSKVGLTVGEVEATLQTKISAAIPSSREVPASVNRGEPIVTVQPRHPVSQTIVKLAQDCADSLAAPVAEQDQESAEHVDGGRRRGLLRRSRA